MYFFIYHSSLAKALGSAAKAKALDSAAKALGSAAKAKALDSASFIHHSPLTNIHLFQRFTDEQLEKIRQQLVQEEDAAAGKPNILCKTCQYPITSHQHKIEVNGNHRHLCRNPADFIFEIGCFALANGCVNHGIATLENTWFPGFAWRYAICANCYAHLGWFYQSSHDSFYGLILNQLIEKEV